MASQKYCFDGVYEKFHHNGRIKRSGLYDRNRKCGPWLVFDKDGTQLEYCEYVNGVRCGKYETQYETGTYEMGEKHGLWKGWHDKEQTIPKYVEQYNNGELYGECKTFYPDGMRCTTNWYSTYGLFRCEEYYPNGCIKHAVAYLSGKKHNTEIFYHNGDYCDKLPERCYEYDDDGIIDSIWESRDTKCKTYLKTYVNSDCVRHGKCSGKVALGDRRLDFYPNVTGQYDNGKKTGEWTFTDITRGFISGHFNEDQPCGEWVFNFYQIQRYYTVDFSSNPTLDDCLSRLISDISSI